MGAAAAVNAGDADMWVGKDVLCKGKHGLVRFVGTTQFADGVWVGVEFSKAPAGRNDGEVQGVRYFGPTSPNHGILLRPDSEFLQPFTAEDAAALKIQSAFRRKRDRSTNEYRQACRALDKLESNEEREKLRTNLNCVRTSQILENDGHSMPLSATLLPDDFLTQHETPENGIPRIQLEQVAVEGTEVSDGASRYSVSAECVDAVLQYLKGPFTQPIGADCVTRLIRGVYDLLEPKALVEIELPPSPGHLIIVGDTHGQLEDFLWLLFEHGEPSTDNVYLINGDICDRGNHAVEILVLILLFKLKDPRCIYVNRGNHEDASMNESYGFFDECVQKWGRRRGPEIFDHFNTLFMRLPLYTLVDSNVFVVHGGLFREYYSLPQLRVLDHCRPVSTLDFNTLDVVVYDSLWSDPQKKNGIGGNPRGDSIISFGPDVTTRFLEDNDLRLIVRSHQVPDDGHGFEWHHRGQCITIFSASNYCGDYGNLGAVLILSRGEKDHVVEHWAPSKEELLEFEAEADQALARVNSQAKCLGAQRRKLRASQKKMETDILKRVQELVVRHKTELFEYWSSWDNSPNGMFLIPAARWRKGCAEIIDDTLPWVRIQEVMAVVDPNVNLSTEPGPVVHYVKFLTRYRVGFDASYGLSAGGWERAVWSRIMETLLRADLPLREALAALDHTRDGLVSGVEFSRLLASCHVDIPPLQAKTLLRSIISNPMKDSSDGSLSESTANTMGRASVWDVLGRLQVSLPIASKANSEEEAAWAVPKLKALASAVINDVWARLIPEGDQPGDWPASKVLAIWFETMDASRSGFLEYDEFVAGLKGIADALEKGGCPSDDESLHRLARHCDIVANGRINYFEFLNSLTWEDSLGDELRLDLMESIHAWIYFNSLPIRCAFKKFDTERSGCVTPKNCADAFKAVRAALSERGEEQDSSNLTCAQIDAITLHLAVDDDGLIDYESFLRSFRIVDTYVGISKSG